MKTTQKRLQKLRTTLSEKNIPAILISQPENRYYLSCFSGSAGYLLITQEKQILATDFRYIEQVKRQSPGFSLFEIKGEMSAWFPAFISGLGLKELFFESEDITFDRYSKLKKIIAPLGIKLKPSSGLVGAMRAVKEPGEIALIEQAVAVSDAAIEHIRRAARPGMTEIQMAWKIEKYMREHGSQTVPFEVIVAAGKNAALPHHRPSYYVVQAGEPIIIDIGAKCEGYVSDLTRTIGLGKEDKQFRRIHGIVLEAQTTAEEQIRSGMSGSEADAIARNIIESAGYGDKYGHGLGHGLGLVIHEKPYVGVTSKDVLADGMVFTVEPGIYLPEWGGVRIEDTVVLKHGKIRVLSKSRK
ncbi:MAG: M24 family metallopeptidase [Dehalococcoidia bacterium]|nr:MAG: M24 family metallopeptidase [Dehalococcoidia bacterium]